jgi:glucose-6-phosphate-specific signal transduction histidine kinase
MRTKYQPPGRGEDQPSDQPALRAGRGNNRRAHYGSERTRLTVEDRVVRPAGAALAGVGGGRGLAGLRERVERAGGSLQAGPTEAGWRVELDVPG